MTKAEVLAAVNSRTNRELTDVDTELGGVLKKLSTDYDFLQKSGTITTEAGTREYDLPDYANNVIAVQDLDKLDFNDLIRRTSEGSPSYYALFGKKIVFAPIPSAEEAITIYYSYSHPDDLSDILFDDRFKECVIEGVCYEVYKGVGQAELGMAHKIAYVGHLNLLLRTIPQADFVEYRDL